MTENEIMPDESPEGQQPPPEESGNTQPENPEGFIGPTLPQEGEQVAPEAEDSEQSAGQQSDETSLFEDILNRFPEEGREPIKEALQNLVNKESSVDELISSAKKAGIQPDELEDVLEAGGHERAKIDAAVARKEELKPDNEEQEPEESETPEQVSSTGELKEVLDQTKEFADKARQGEVTEDEIKEFEEKTRGRIGNWLDENPGTFNRVNRLGIRPAVKIILMMLLLYLSSLHIMTKWSTKRVGGK